MESGGGQSPGKAMVTGPPIRVIARAITTLGNQVKQGLVALRCVLPVVGGDGAERKMSCGATSLVATGTARLTANSRFQRNLY